MKLSAISSFIYATGYFFSGRIRYPKDSIGKKVLLDGEEWVAFRQIVVKPGKDQPVIPQAVFRPRFHVKGMSIKQNILFSNIPIPFIIGLPGFRSKTWLYNETTGDFSGYYEWDTLEDAENYGKSFAAKFMTDRSEPRSVSFKSQARTGPNPFADPGLGYLQ